jgi:hypothetical protein
MVSSVSFGSIPYADLIKAPQAHRQEGQQPSAAATLNGEKKSSSGKKAVGTLVGLTAVAAGLVFLGKKAHGLNVLEMKDGTIKNILSKDWAQNILKNKTVTQITGACDNIYTKVTGKAKQIWEQATALVGKLGKKTTTEG